MNQRNAAAWLVLIIWAALYARRIEDASFPVPGEVTPVVLAAAAYLFGKDIRDRLSGRREDDDE